MFEPGHNVSLWLHRIDSERQLRTWPDPVAEASLLMTDVPLTWFLHTDFDDYTPSTAEARVYAAGGRTGPLQRTPKNRTPWTPEGIQAARDARTNRGNAAASGSGATPTPAPAPRLVPGHRTYPDPGTTP